MSELNGQVEETPKERRMRQRREASARWRAKPGNAERQREAQARWQADPKNRERVRVSRAEAKARRDAENAATEAAANLRDVIGAGGDA